MSLILKSAGDVSSDVPWTKTIFLAKIHRAEPSSLPSPVRSLDWTIFLIIIPVFIMDTRRCVGLGLFSG